MPDSSPSTWPWHHFTSPLTKWQSQPSFVVGEYLFIALALLALAHAWRQGDERKKHVMVWVAAIIAGTANDLIFMTLPLVDNFWQAQATWMITARLPLYIPCVYVCFMYLPTVAVWRLNLPPLSRAALSGLAGIVFYAPYDIIGAKFLWWTWHDTDRPISLRLLGVPIGSTVWVIIFVATFAWIIGRVADRDPKVSPVTFAKGVGFVAAFTTLMMMVQMAPLQQLDGGIPGVRGLVALVLSYGGIAAYGWRKSVSAPTRPEDRALLGGIVAYFAVLALIMAIADPKSHKSDSVHQTYGACHVEAKDIAGNVRYAFLCAEDFDEDFSFDCVDRLPDAGARWYTVCGRAHTSFPKFMGGVGALSALGALLYAYLLGALGRRAASPGVSSAP